MIHNKKTRKQRGGSDSKKQKTIVCKIYANWCGHCEHLKPVWAELKNIMKPNKNITMIEIEESEMNEKLGELKNICKTDIEVQGFPTIVKICTGGKNKKPIVEYYQNERTVEAMQAWIMKNTNMGGSNHRSSKRSSLHRNSKRSIKRKM